MIYCVTITDTIIYFIDAQIVLCESPYHLGLTLSCLCRFLIRIVSYSHHIVYLPPVMVNNNNFLPIHIIVLDINNNLRIEI